MCTVLIGLLTPVFMEYSASYVSNAVQILDYGID